MIEDPHTVRLVGSGRTRPGASGSWSRSARHPVKEPAVPGIELAITSNEVFELESLPERILVIGGGYIAVEFAGVFAALGSRTTLLHRGDRLLRGFDEEVRDALGEAYATRHGPAARADADADRAPRRRPPRRSSTTAARSRSTRSWSPPAGARTSPGSAWSRVGIETDAAGAIPVDAYSQTCGPVDLRGRRRDRTAPT